MSVHRRKFLKFLTTATAVTVGSKTVSANENFEGYPDSYGVLVDTTQCIGSNCRKCEEACKKANHLLLEPEKLADNSVFEHERRTDANNFTIVNRFKDPDKPGKDIYVKRQCMHCQEPACASACLVKAFTKTPQGSVIYNKDVCIGCRYCMVACPFYAPAYEYFNASSPKVRKCTLCFEKIKEGKRPACVEICPKEILTFGKRSELIELAREKIRKHPDQYINHIYGETEVGGTSWMYLAGTDFANIGFDTTLGKLPYPLYTRGFLSAVPMVLTIWPVLLVGLYKAAQFKQERAKKIGLDQEGENHGTSV